MTATPGGGRGTTEPVLRIRDVGQDFSGVTVLDGVSLEIRRGVSTALVGPNGAGKSTLMNVIAGSQLPTRGSVLHDGTDITRMLPFQRARRGVVRTFQLPSDFGRLTVLENLLVGAAGQSGDSFTSAFFQRRHVWRDRERAAVQRARELLDRFGLAAKEDHYARDLSGGQRRIVELLRAVMAEPQVLLLDEPFAGVHPTVIERIAEFLKDLQDSGVTVVLIAHELDTVERLCDAVVVMARGAVLFEGTMAMARRDQKVVAAYVAG
jgi:ABC-type branched-subunit amino acid transport system ATPase component